IRIVEVGMRDGLQNEAVFLTEEQRITFAKKLAGAGLVHIEAGAFVSPHWIPQMQGSASLISKLLRAQKAGRISKKVQWSALVPNVRGLTSAIESGVKEVAIFGAVSETFSQKNTNVSVAESLTRFKEVMKLAQQNRIKVRGYLSTAFACPYEGKISPQKTVKMIHKLLDLGVYEVSVGDTIGVATPRHVENLLKLTPKQASKLAMHFHDTRGTALANIVTSLDYGITTFDASIGGLGGCPYAPGAAGNVATEDVVYMLEGMGYKTGVNLDQLIKTTRWMAQQLGRPLPSKVGLAGRGNLI
ncbi:MAG: hydroxymethylglutaryl-CoA lyase, partial [Bdellovibrionales bacterium]|nr:hydroxymethylglutaryl-CoA lyase [Bdellovibrionales bacterium]